MSTTAIQICEYRLYINSKELKEVLQVSNGFRDYILINLDSLQKPIPPNSVLYKVLRLEI
ncbi:CLUMA_CG018464, isoform A [Clunio marinus]|uniref:CLUMA_CG018464, isoform A n=1 Tax=Clunio marinus TaxID=568069 RepID=A0A1J1IZ08_9DIPT|nr:CLUMA_CG018464, isoform A [Clunio marinus]